MSQKGCLRKPGGDINGKPICLKTSLRGNFFYGATGRLRKCFLFPWGSRKFGKQHGTIIKTTVERRNDDDQRNKQHRYECGAHNMIRGPGLEGGGEHAPHRALLRRTELPDGGGQGALRRRRGSGGGGFRSVLAGVGRRGARVPSLDFLQSPRALSDHIQKPMRVRPWQHGEQTGRPTVPSCFEFPLGCLLVPARSQPRCPPMACDTEARHGPPAAGVSRNASATASCRAFGVGARGWPGAGCRRYPHPISIPSTIHSGVDHCDFGSGTPLLPTREPLLETAACPGATGAPLGRGHTSSSPVGAILHAWRSTRSYITE